MDARSKAEGYGALARDGVALGLERLAYIAATMAAHYARRAK
jgi:hypothetical protein